jgi:hypothetical protein
VAPTAAVPWIATAQTTAATLNATAKVDGLPAILWGARPLFRALFAPGPTLTLARFWLGMTSTSWTTLLSLDSLSAGTVSGAAFRRSTNVGDTNWKCVVSNGTAETVVDSGVAVVGSEGRKFEILTDGTTVQFRIMRPMESANALAGDSLVVANITTNLPAATAVLRQGAGVQTLEAAAKAVHVGGQYWETEL